MWHITKFPLTLSIAAVNYSTDYLLKDCIHMLKKVIVFFLITLLPACAGLDIKPEQFKVNISSMQILESSLMEQHYQIDLRIMNRSKNTFNIDGMSFDIELNDKDFASGVSNKRFKLEPLSDIVISVTITSTIFAFIRQVNHLKNHKSAPFKYELSGNIYTSSSLFGIPFKQKGEINLTADSPPPASTNK